MNEYAYWAEVLWNVDTRDLALLWTALALWVVLILVRPTRTLVLRKTEGGRLEISRHALNRLIEACAEQLKGVVHARAKVWRSGGKLHTLLLLKVRPNANLGAIQGYLEQEVGDIVKVNLGLPDAAGRVQVKVNGVVPESRDF